MPSRMTLPFPLPNPPTHSTDEELGGTNTLSCCLAPTPRNSRSIRFEAEKKTPYQQAGPSSTLQECSADSDLDGVKRLLNLGEDVDGIDEEGNTGLHMAAESGAEEVVR